MCVCGTAVASAGKGATFADGAAQNRANRLTLTTNC